jgi:hypothetical protein
MHVTDHDALAAALANGTPFVPVFDDLKPKALSLTGLINGALAFEHLLAHIQAAQTEYLSALHQRVQSEAAGRAPGATESEVAATLRLAPSTVRTRLADADALTRLFPETLAELSKGRISWAQAKALVDLTSCMADEQARAVQDRVLAEMPSQTPAVTRRRIHRAIQQVDPEGAAERALEATKRRRVELRPEPDGMATLTLFTKADTARAILNRLDTLCKKRLKGDHRTLDQRRADALAEIALTGKGPTGTKPPTAPAMVHVVMNVETLIGWSDAPAELQGYGTITAHEARMMALAPGSELRRIFTAPSGKLLAIDPRKYRRSAALDRLIQATYRTCTFQGCEMQAHRCDLDHKHPFSQGGFTCEHNLHPACRFHHEQKTAGRWKIHCEGDATVWVSTATGRRYVSYPEPYAVIDYEELIE